MLQELRVPRLCGDLLLDTFDRFLEKDYLHHESLLLAGTVQYYLQ